MENETTATNPLIDALFAAGAHFGYGKARRHPSVVPYIYGTKNDSDIIDLEKTVASLATAMEFVKKLGAEGKKILFVGNKSETIQLVKQTAEKIGASYVAERWVGGTFTNFGEIRKRIARLRDLEEGKAKDGWAQYTKGERAVLQKELDQLHRFFDGILGMSAIPGAIIVIDPREESIAVREARDAHVTVVALANTDCDLSDVKYPVVANDAATGSIELFLSKMAEAYEAGRAEAAKKQAAAAATEKAAQ